MSKKFWQNKRIVVTGGTGFLGGYLVREIRKRGGEDIFIPKSEIYDLRKKEACQKVVKGADIVIHLAAKVGGIGFNRCYPGEMFYDNILMGVQMMEESRLAGVEKFVGIGTVCCYPKYTPVPFCEDDIWNGYPEETNAPYGLAKKMLLVQSQAYRAQYGFDAIFLVPVNLYGPKDKIDPKVSHVIPALIKKVIDAKRKKRKQITVWGTGRATREFLFVKDGARGICMATEKYNKSKPVNIGAGFEISIREVVELICELAGYKGKIVWDKSKPDGQPRRSLDTTRAKREFGFEAKTDFTKGLKETIEWYKTKIK